MDLAIFSQPRDDAGLPVLSPLQRCIERRETLQLLRGQLAAEPQRSPSRELRAVLRNVEVLMAEEEQE